MFLRPHKLPTGELREAQDTTPALKVFTISLRSPKPECNAEPGLTMRDREGLSVCEPEIHGEEQTGKIL